MSEDNTQMVRAVRDLKARVSSFLGKQYTLGAVDAMLKIAENHRAEWKRKGLHFPRLTFVLVPRFGAMKMVRADMEREGIQRVVLNLVVEYPTITPEEIGSSIKAAFPNLSSLIDHESHAAREHLRQKRPEVYGEAAVH